MNDKTNDYFDGITNVLLDISASKVEAEQNISKGIAGIKSEIQKFEESKKELAKFKEKELFTLADKQYLHDEIHTLVENGKEVLDTLTQDIKIGSSSSKFEVYAKLMTSILGGLRELRDLNKIVSDMEMFNVKDEGEKKTEVNITVTGKELLDMINAAKANSQMNTISADFVVCEEIVGKGSKKQ